MTSTPPSRSGSSTERAQRSREKRRTRPKCDSPWTCTRRSTASASSAFAIRTGLNCFSISRSNSCVGPVERAGEARLSCMLLALTRAVPPCIVRCELTHLARAPIDVERAAAQHGAYEQALSRLGCTVTRLPDEPDYPDSVFVEDTAVVLDAIAVLARPGAESRRGETDS